MGNFESTPTDNYNNNRQTNNVQNLKPHTPEKWEINFIGDLLLSILASNNVVPNNNWMIKKSELRQEFLKFTTPQLREQFKELNGTDNIGTILYRTGFLCNTPRGSPYYELKSENYIKGVIKQNSQGLNNAKPKVGNNRRRGRNNDEPQRRNNQEPKLDNRNSKSLNNTAQNTSADNNDRIDECYEPTTSKAAVKSNLQRNSEQAFALIIKKSNLDMLFDELPRVPNINLEPKEVSELPIAQVRPIQQETKNQPQYSDEDLNINGNTTEVHTSKYSTFDQATSLALQQQQFEEEELRKKLQQELKDKEYAEKLQQLFEDEKLEKQNAQQNEPISIEIPTTSPSLPEPQLLPPPSRQPSQPRQQPPLTQEKIFENRIAQLDNEKEQYEIHIRKLRFEHRLEHRLKQSHNERSWRQHLLTYEQEEDAYEEFMEQYRHKREDLLDQYDDYLRATGRKKDECCV